MVNQTLGDRVLREFSQVVPRLYRRIQTFRLKIARELSLSRAQMEILSLLAERGDLSPTDIATSLVIAKPNVTTAVDDLVSRSFVEREYQPQDRRVVLLKLTESGLGVRKRIRESFSQLVMTSLSELGEEELEILDLGLKSLNKVVDHMKHESQA
jgi:DNA-binding MarR family transcriptional regulator